MKDDSQTSARSSHDAAIQEFGWRNTPRINFAPERRLFPFSPLITLLVIALLIEALGAQIVYGRLRDAQSEALAANGRLETVERALRQERAVTEDAIVEIGDIDEEIKRIEERRADAIEAHNRLTQNRPEWAAALQALLQSDSPDFRIYSLSAAPPADVGSPAQIKLSATAPGPDTIGGFLDYMADVSDFLELASWNTALTSSGKTVFEAVMDLK